MRTIKTERKSFKVRAATAFALGTFIRSGGKTERNEHANSIDHAVALRLVNAVSLEASPLVRKEVCLKKIISLNSLTESNKLI